MIRIIETDYSLQDGFAWTTFEIGGSEFYLQACLTERKEAADDQRRYELVKAGKDIYRKAIKINDDGMEDGISGEANAHALFNLSPELRAKAFKKAMRSVGIRFE